MEPSKQDSPARGEPAKSVLPHHPRVTLAELLGASPCEEAVIAGFAFFLGTEGKPGRRRGPPRESPPAKDHPSYQQYNPSRLTTPPRLELAAETAGTFRIASKTVGKTARTTRFDVARASDKDDRSLTSRKGECPDA